MTTVEKHIRKKKNGATAVRRHYRKGSTHRRGADGRNYVFVDGFWKHDDYGRGPKPGQSYESLMRQKQMYEKDLADALAGRDIAPQRKLGLLTRRLRKINRYLSKKTPAVK